MCHRVVREAGERWSMMQKNLAGIKLLRKGTSVKQRKNVIFSTRTVRIKFSMVFPSLLALDVKFEFV
jgi:hypothetical protein